MYKESGIFPVFKKHVGCVFHSCFSSISIKNIGNQCFFGILDLKQVFQKTKFIRKLIESRFLCEKQQNSLIFIVNIRFYNNAFLRVRTRFSWSDLWKFWIFRSFRNSLIWTLKWTQLRMCHLGYQCGNCPKPVDFQVPHKSNPTRQILEFWNISHKFAIFENINSCISFCLHNLFIFWKIYYFQFLNKIYLFLRFWLIFTSLSWVSKWAGFEQYQHGYPKWHIRNLGILRSRNLKYYIFNENSVFLHFL